MTINMINNNKLIINVFLLKNWVNRKMIIVLGGLGYDLTKFFATCFTKKNVKGALQ